MPGRDSSIAWIKQALAAVMASPRAMCAYRCARRALRQPRHRFNSSIRRIMPMNQGTPDVAQNWVRPGDRLKKSPGIA
ncbi:hypothetical protein, partial [Xanthomonas axonopodis]|uniref:hypothetical protein n=1 Tax=Xanthomonas axonopodis TaxID=53413 RepID=UPI001C276083